VRKDVAGTSTPSRETERWCQADAERRYEGQTKDPLHSALRSSLPRLPALRRRRSGDRVIACRRWSG
jgi:hypothetical protein